MNGVLEYTRFFFGNYSFISFISFSFISLARDGVVTQILLITRDSVDDDDGAMGEEEYIIIIIYVFLICH